MTAARRVVAVVPDLMDRSRLGGPGLEVEVVPVARVAARAGEEPAPDLVVVDLSRPGALEAAGAVADRGVAVVGFAPHVDDALLADARRAGVEAVARSVFFRRWPELPPLFTRGG